MDTLTGGENEYSKAAPERGGKGGKILSVIVPAYNVSDYIFRCANSLTNIDSLNDVEVIIVNDGSKDDTLKKANELRERRGDGNIVIIDKENGGHGSTINAGLDAARGKYVRIVDGDDYVNSHDFEKLIGILRDETSDIVVTDYSEDNAEKGEIIPCLYYKSMDPGKQYVFDEVCRNDASFPEYGPILATANYRLEILKGRFRLTEHSYYIDMEFDAYSTEAAKTIVYYPLDVYRYYKGRSDQSISQNSYVRNFKQHENVIFNIIEYYYKGSLSDAKRKYVLDKIIFPMITAHYTILINYMRSGKEYFAFEKRLAAYPEIADDPAIATKMKKFHRATRGVFVKHDQFIKKIARKNEQDM